MTSDTVPYNFSMSKRSVMAEAPSSAPTSPSTARNRPARSAELPLSAVSQCAEGESLHRAQRTPLALNQGLIGGASLPSALSPPVGFAANPHFVAAHRLGHVISCSQK
eukprot:9291368-Pyramimonas_sp.AAC.1